MKRLSKIIIVFSQLIAFLIITVIPVNAQNTTLYFSPSSTSVELNQSFAITIMINTGGDAVNGVTADFTYPSERLEVVSIDSSTSDFSIQAEEDYSSAGTVYISRAISGGDSLTGTGVVAIVNFRATTAGTSTLAFTDDAIVTSASEDPTNVLGSTETATITSGSGTLPVAGLFDKPVLLFGIAIALLLISIGFVGILQYLKDRKHKLNNSIQNHAENT